MLYLSLSAPWGRNMARKDTASAKDFVRGLTDLECARLLCVLLDDEDHEHLIDCLTARLRALAEAMELAKEQKKLRMIREGDPK